MSTEKKFIINPDSAGKYPEQIIIREGDAPVPKPEKSILISGILGAPFQFLNGKREKIGAIDSHLIVDPEKGELTLKIQDTDAETMHVISGKLTRDKYFSEFGINTEKRYTVRDFQKFIRKMKYFFDEKEVCDNLVLSISKWAISVEKVIVDHNDGKSGNSNFQLEVKVGEVAGLNKKFNLLIPIYKGYPPMKFEVEIGLDPTNASVQLFLVSDELFELELTLSDRIMKEEVALFNDFNCSKVFIS